MRFIAKLVLLNTFCGDGCGEEKGIRGRHGHDVAVGNVCEAKYVVLEKISHWRCYAPYSYAFCAVLSLVDDR